MPNVEIYTSPMCGYCHAAKRLLSKKGVQFAEFDVARDPSRRTEMLKKAKGGRTVPQIFIGKTHVGGCDELFELDRSGELDRLLAA